MPKLQNLRTSTASKRPVATNLDPGQIAINYEQSDPAIYFRAADDSLIKVAPVYIGSSAPNATPAGSSGNAKGEFWIDTTNGGKVLKYWDGSNWQEVTASTLSSTLGPTLGGTGVSTYTLGDLLYGNGTNTLAKLGGNTTSTKQFLTQTGTGSVSAAPAWGTIAAADVSGLATSATTDTTSASNISSGTLNAARLPSVNIGTTVVDLTRASGSLSLTGISIDGNAGTVTNGVYTTGSYSDPSWLTISKSKVGLGSVENTALSTWAGSTNITTLGTISTGTVPAANVSGLAASATTDTTSASNISSGTLASARLGTTGTPQFASVAVGTALASNVDVDVSGTYAQVPVAVAALAIDCSTGNYFTKTINGNSTFTVTNVPASRSYAFTLELTHTSGTITWFSGVIWPGGTAPTLTTGKVHLFVFQTSNGGTTWRASSLINYAS